MLRWQGIAAINRNSSSQQSRFCSVCGILFLQVHPAHVHRAAAFPMLKAENSCGADKLPFLTSASRCRFPVCSGTFQARIADTGTVSSDISLRYSEKVPALRRHGRHWPENMSFPCILCSIPLPFAVLDADSRQNMALILKIFAGGKVSLKAPTLICRIFIGKRTEVIVSDAALTVYPFD